MGKKNTPAVKQKKTVSSARVRISTKKVSSGHTDLNSSFIQSAISMELDLTAASNSTYPSQSWDKIGLKFGTSVQVS